MVELIVKLQLMLTDLDAVFRRRSEERGATAVEYALMVGLIGVAIMGSVVLFGTRLRTAFGYYANTVPS
jgi:pilus assembly protein Flp/PilA